MRKPALAILIVFLIGTLPVFISCATVDSTTTVDAGGAPESSPTISNAQDHQLKRRVAVARFSNETLYGKSVLLLREADFLTRQAADILVARLAETGQFDLIEYSDSETLLRAVDNRAVPEIGVPADFVIVGSVTEFGRETVGNTGVFSRTKTQKAHARVNLRLVDVRSSRVIFAAEGTCSAESEVGTTFGVGTTAGYDSTLNDKAISAAVSKVVGNIVETLLEQPWRSYVLEVQGNSVFIAGGASQGIRVGDRFAVVQRGRLIDNPQTGVPVELPGQQVGVLEVQEVFGTTSADETSRCLLQSGSIAAGDLSRYFVTEVQR